METGFAIEVFNNTMIEKEIKLFTQDGLVEGITAKVVNSELDYNFLLNIAINKGFKGSGIIINTELINQICVQDEQNSETIIINKILQNKQIILNGHSKYISMILPPKSDFPIIIQLIHWL